MNNKWLPEKEFHKILGEIPIVCIDLIIEYDGKFLMAKRKINPYNNKWAFPGGRIWHGETLRASIRRIAMNEMGIKIPQEVKEEFSSIHSTIFPMFYNRHDISIVFHIKLKQRPLVKIDKTHYSVFNWFYSLSNNTGILYKKEWKNIKG